MLLQREVLLQRTRLLGPAFVAAVAYVDPGNVATNTQAGAAFGYLLLWVLVGATFMAGLVQYLSAKVGWLTGETLPALVARRNSRLPRICYWIQAELVAVATDLAEIVGGAVALNLLFGLPLVSGALITTAVSTGLLFLQNNRSQPHVRTSHHRDAGRRHDRLSRRLGRLAARLEGGCCWTGSET
jgi:manganese transport protein